jgi:hypothetical protein
MFDVVDSETDHLPVDTERKNWEAEVLKRKDAEIAETKALYEDDVIAACRKQIQGFASTTNSRAKRNLSSVLSS